MTPIQGALWNSLTDEWQYFSEIKHKVFKNYGLNVSDCNMRSFIERCNVKTRRQGTGNHHLYRLPPRKIRKPSE